MADQDLALRAQGLSDVELALLLSLVAKEHCLIRTDQDLMDALEEEVKLITSNIFGLSSASLPCTESTTLEEFTRSILIEKPAISSPGTPTFSNRRASAYKFERSYSGDRYQIAQVLIIRAIETATHQVQMQALELLRTRRIFTHTEVYTAPKPFLMVFLSPVPSMLLSKHLNDFIFISHVHSIDDGFPNTEESSEWIDDDTGSISSVVHRTATKVSSTKPLFSVQDIESLSSMTETVVLSTEVKRYLHDVLTFLRFHRAVASGVSPKATRHLELLSRCLAPLHGLAFATPSLVALAARKIYSHRITLTSPENERSMQYGSDSTAVAEVLADMTVELVIEETLTDVDVPV